MAFLMNFSELRDAAGAVLLEGEGRGVGFSSVAIDSRVLTPGCLFVALPGKNRDGHKFIEDAFNSGAAGVMAERSRVEDTSLGIAALAKKAGGTLVIVEDTLRGFQDAARAYLEKFPRLLRIGITGSSGKTTTKEIVSAIAAQEKRIVMNSGNLNSETGLPLSVFNVRSEHEVGIFEAGMNRREEIAELARVLKPQLALITNIGSSHIGILGSKAAIAEEKKDIFSQFSGSETAFVPADDEYREFLSRDVKGRVLFYGKNSLPELDSLKSRGLEGTEINWAGKSCLFTLPGSFNLKNAVSALALAREIPISAEGIRKGLESVKPLFGRGEIISGRTTVIRDCYNSNPESLEAAVDFCDGLDWPGRRIYIIGSMLELGESSPEAHRRIGRVLASSLAEKIFLYGRETETTAAVLASRSFPFFHTESRKDLEEALEQYLLPGDLVLLKGSRGCALEQLTLILTENSPDKNQGGERAGVEGFAPRGGF
jgi:UDP-N-acetylmuramoyl-tripeptide--D-alanyl-D-alanine ligase